MFRKISCICYIALVVCLLSSCCAKEENNISSVNYGDLSASKKEDTLIATATTTFDSSEIGRTTNIRLSAEAINGTVLNAGDKFSFNEIVGERTEEKGYLPADIFVNTGREILTISGIGGGICQVSSTICMAVQNTNLKILERNTHSKEVSYCRKNQEAMINWGTSDFVFLNTYDFNIKLELVFKVEGSITCNIYSV